MRLIDADALEQAAIERYKSGLLTKSEAETVADMALNAPTITNIKYTPYTIETTGGSKTETINPVKHGRWESVATTGGIKECSRCGYITSAVGYYAPGQTGIPQSAPYNYCPCCGARMDGGTEDVDG